MKSNSFYPNAPKKGWTHIKSGEFILTPWAYTSADGWLDHVSSKFPTIDLHRDKYIGQKIQDQLVVDFNNSKNWVRTH